MEAGVYPFPEWADVVYGYLKQVHDEIDAPVSVYQVTTAMNKDLPDSTNSTDVAKALSSLLEGRLISWEGRGLIPLEGSMALQRQLELEEVRPFTRDYGDSPEAHEDKLWDFRTALKKPEAGGKWGLGAQGHLMKTDRRWTGLTKEGM